MPNKIKNNKKTSNRWNENDVKIIQKKIVKEKKNKTKQNGLAEALKSMGLGGKIEQSKEIILSVKKKKQGINTAPIFKSLDESTPQTSWGVDWLAINIFGGRILTYNELFSILQYRKYEAFRYKKICRNVVKRALISSEKKPFFDGPTRLTLIRVGAKEMDRDALPIVFKYFLDSLKIEGVIADDNPNIIVDIVTHQEKGEPRLSMKLERISDWVALEVPSWNDLTNGKKL